MNRRERVQLYFLFFSNYFSFFLVVGFKCCYVRLYWSNIASS